MKKLLLVITAIFLLTACSSGQDLQAKKPKLPSKKPGIPSVKNLQANLLRSTDTASADEPDMGRLVESINKNLELSNITGEDLERGWYYGKEDERKFGTPGSWEWVEDGKNSRWVSPNAVDVIEDISDDELCRRTAGIYVISCVEREVPFCEYVTESECRCSDGSGWIEGQGCILMKDNGDFIKIQNEELKQGWYFGLPNQKKLGTPSSWEWIEAGKQSKWRNPPPENL